MRQRFKAAFGSARTQLLILLSTLLLSVTVGWAVSQLTDDGNTVDSYEDLVSRYLDYRDHNYRLCVPSWYMVGDQIEAIEGQYGLAGFQDQPDWFVRFDMGELYIKPHSALSRQIDHGARLVFYEDMVTGELLVLRDDGSSLAEEIVYTAPLWPEVKTEEALSDYLFRELSKRRVVWYVTLKDKATADAEREAQVASANLLLPETFGGSEMLLWMGGETCTQIVFTGMEKPVTNDTVDLGFCIPDGITNIDIFVASEPPLSGHPWELTATNIPVVSNSVIWSWSGLSISNLVFAAGDGSVDTDMDGLKDSFEFYVSGSSMDLWDTDGDGVNDGIEWAAGTNPNDPNAPPNINGTISYGGLQTNAIIVIAALDSNSWYSAYSTTMGGVGSYQIANVPATSLYVKAYRDLNGNGLRDAEEAVGWYLNNPIEASGMVLGVNITLEEPDTDGDGVSDYAERTIFRTSPEDAADIPQQLTRASVSCYYGYGSGNTNWHYQEQALGLTKKYFLGSGWVVSNVFLPDLSQSSAAIQYGEALGIGSHLSGGWIYATDTTLDHDVSMSKGWLWGEGYLTDYREPSAYIYYLQPNDDDFPDLFTFSKLVSGNPGKDSVGHGWTRPGSFTPDLTQVASQIYQGLANAHGYSTNLAYRHILPASETSGYKKGQLGTGWASPAGYIPNTSVSRTYYYGVYDDALGVSGYSSSTLIFGFNSYITLGSGYLAGNNFIPNPATQGGPPISSYDQNGDGFIDIPMASPDEFARIDDSPLLLLDVTIGDASGSHTELYGFDLDDFSFDMPYVNQTEFLFTHKVPLERGQTYSGTLRDLPDDDDDGDYTFLVGGALHGPDTNLTYSGQDEPGVVVQAGFPNSGEQDTNIFGYVNDSGFNSGSMAFTVIVPRVNIRAHSAGTYQSAGTEITSFHEYLPNAVVLPVSTGTVGSALSTNVTMSALLFEKFLPTSLDEGVLNLMISDTNVLALYDSSNKRILPMEYDLDTGSITNALHSLTLYDRTFHAVGMNPGSASVTLEYLDVNSNVVCSDTVTFGILSLELDVRETARPNNRMGPDDPRLVPPDDDNARDKLLVWGGSSSTISFDAVRPPGITGPIWIQIEDSGGAVQQFEKLELADKTYTESYAVNKLDPDLTLKYGIDQDNSSTLTGDEVKGSYEIYGVSENERVASVNTLNATLATALYDLADALVRKFVEGSFSAPGPFQTDFRPDNYTSPGNITLSPNPAAEVVHNFGGTFTQLPFVTMNGRQYHEASITMPLFAWGASNPANDLLRGHGDFEEAIENYANSLSYSAVGTAWNAGTATANPDIRICSFAIPPTEDFFDFPPAGTVGLGDCDVASGALIIHVEKVGSSYYVYANDTDHASVSSVILEDKWDYNYFKDVGGAAGFESQAAAQVQCSHGQSGVPSGSGEVFFVRIEVDGELDEAISIVVGP